MIRKFPVYITKSRQLIILIILIVCLSGFSVAQPTTSTQTDWSKRFEDWENLATVIAIIIGGLWAYLKYFRGRTFKPQLELKVSGKISTTQGVKALLATMQIKNIGLSHVKLIKDYSLLEVSLYETGAYKFIYEQEKNQEAVLFPIWNDPASFKVFKDHGWVEPTEIITDQALLTLPEGEYAACKIDFRITSRKFLGIGWSRTWSTTAIVELKS